MLLDGKRAIVTGGGRGIGVEVARLFASEGARVAIVYHHSADDADRLAAELGGIAVQADLSDPEQAERMAEQVVGGLGGIDILVNAAASFHHSTSFEESTWGDYTAEFAGVVGATVNPTHAVIPTMIAQNYGRIINFVAALLWRPTPGTIVHATAKSALVGFTRYLARELGPHGITVNMISPGMTLTENTLSKSQTVRDQVAEQTPLRRLAEPIDAAKVALFYASSLADFVTAANVAPDGGLAVL